MCKPVDYLNCATPVWQWNTTCVDLQDELYESIICLELKNCSVTLVKNWCDIYKTNNSTILECIDLRCYKISNCPRGGRTAGGPFVLFFIFFLFFGSNLT